MNPPPVVLWRLLVAGSGAAGVALAARQYDVWWTALSQLSSLAVAVGYIALAVREPRSPWPRGALVTDLLLVSLAYLPMQNGNLTDPYSLLEHVLTPALVLLDFVLVGGNQAAIRWWHPLSWLLPPALYLGWYVTGDLGVYAALDPGDPAAFAGRVTMLLGLLLGVGFALYGAGRRRVVVFPG